MNTSFKLRLYFFHNNIIKYFTIAKTYRFFIIITKNLSLFYNAM